MFVFFLFYIERVLVALKSGTSGYILVYKARRCCTSSPHGHWEAQQFTHSLPGEPPWKQEQVPDPSLPHFHISMDPSALFSLQYGSFSFNNCFQLILAWYQQLREPSAAPSEAQTLLGGRNHRDSQRPHEHVPTALELLRVRAAPSRPLGFQLHQSHRLRAPKSPTPRPGCHLRISSPAAALISKVL